MDKWRSENPEKMAASRHSYKKNHAERVAQSKKEEFERNKEDLRKQIKRFRHECHGPIFTCICCMRDLFHRSVVELKGDSKQKILNENQMHGYLNFDESLKVKDEIQDEYFSGDQKIIKTKRIQEGYSLCRTCMSYLKKSKMPPMCSKNGLEPAVIPDCLSYLSNLEKQLIVKNLIFIKVRQLPKTRMMAMNDRVINLPIGDENIAKQVTSLPRTKDNSGMICVGLKRKSNMKNYFKGPFKYCLIEKRVVSRKDDYVWLWGWGWMGVYGKMIT